MAIKHILVPTDFGDASREALERALDLAIEVGAKITVLHTTWLPPFFYMTYAEGLSWPTGQLEGEAKKELDAAVAKAKERYANVEGIMDGGGEPWEKILETSKARGADLIVMGTHGRRGISRVLLGSVAEKVVRLSPIPVMTVSAEAERRAKEHALERPAHTAGPR